MIRNFLFHRVHPERDPMWDPMDPVLFEKCIKYISRKYTVRLFEDLAFDKVALASKNKYATIMFDDGYKDNYEFALPILEKYNVKASFYVVTDCIDENVPTWTHVLEHLFINSSKTKVRLDHDFLPDDLRSYSSSKKEQLLSFARKLLPYIKRLSHEQRDLVIEDLLDQFSDVELPQLMMNWDDLREMKKLGHFVGSHTVSHTMLGTIEDESFLKEELSDSGKAIERELGYYPSSISYPVGSYNEKVIQLSKECGYRIGLAVKQDIYDPEKENLFEVSRIELYNEPWWKTKMRISNRLEQVKKIIRYR